MFEIQDTQQQPVELATFARFAELAPDALIAVDRAGRIVAANTQVQRVFGYTRDELLGRPLDDLVPERLRSGHAHNRDSYFGDPRTRAMGEGRLDLRGVRRDGSEFPAQISLSAIATDVGVVATAAVRDISDRVRAERERVDLETRLVREQAMAQASRMESIGQLAGGVAHDFNNLLSVVLGNAGFLSAALEPGTPGHEEVQEIRRACTHAASLTRQLLMFSRREEIEPLPLDLNLIVREVERLLRRTLGEQVELVTGLAPDLPAVLGDPGSLEQVLVNLAVNARDAMPRGGTLTIATAHLKLTAEDLIDRPELAPGPFVRLSVADTGEGMTDEVARRAVEPFYSTKPKTEGTGLGLATVYGIARQLGGGLRIDSKVGAGTVMAVDLPVASGATLPAPSAAETRDAPVTGQHVLLVEDDDAVRRMAARLLESDGYYVTTASNGGAALEQLAGAEPPVDVLLTDVIMPEMNGVELAAQVRVRQPGLAVVLMSGYIDPLIEVDQLEEVAIVQKPFTGASLTQAIQKALGR